MGRDHQAATGCVHVVHVLQRTHGAAADQHISGKRFDQRIDAGQRAGPVQRDFQRAKAAGDQGLADGGGVLQIQPAQDRNQGHGAQRVQQGVRGVHGVPSAVWKYAKART